MPEVVAIQTEGKAYAETVKKEGSGHRRGPPAPHMFVGFVESLLLHKEGLGRRTYEYLKLVHDTMLQVPTCDLAFMVRACRLQKVYDSSKLRLIIGLREDIWLAILPEDQKEKFLNNADFCARSIRLSLRQALLEATDARLLSGKAPPGAMEVILQEALE